MLYVAIAGPISNIITAIISGILLKFIIFDLATTGAFGAYTVPLIQFLVWMIFIGVVLAVFNMLPIPPLDGSRVLYGLLPDHLANSIKKIETYGILIVFGIILFGGRTFSYILIYPFLKFLEIFSFNNLELNIILNVVFNR